MLPEFVDFLQKLFPSIDPYTAEKAKHVMSQFDGSCEPPLIQRVPALDFWQGDIYSEIPFFFTDDSGEIKMIKRKAQLLSNTCDASRDEHLLFAAIHPLTDLKENESMIDAIKRNKRYGALYFPDNLLKDEYVDFELINTVSRKSFEKLCEENKVRRIASLTQVGYFMLISKLTVFFMRPEDAEVNASRT